MKKASTKDYGPEPRTELVPSSPSVLGVADSRDLAIAAGDYRAAVMRDVRRILAESHGNQLLAAKTGLERLAAANLITDQEGRALGQVCEGVFAVQRGKSRADEVSAQVREIYDQMLVDNRTSPVALAIASIASGRSLTPLPVDPEMSEGTVARISSSDKVDMGIVGGAIGGAVIGGAIGGAGGAIIGAVIGGIGAGIGTACAT